MALARFEHHNRNGSQDGCIVNSLLLLFTDELPIANLLFTVTNVRFRVSPFSSRLPRGPLRKTLPGKEYHTLSSRHGRQQHLAPIHGQSLWEFSATLQGFCARVILDGAACRLGEHGDVHDVLGVLTTEFCTNVHLCRTILSQDSHQKIVQLCVWKRL